jgi:hypothetical protein
MKPVSMGVLIALLEQLQSEIVASSTGIKNVTLKSDNTAFIITYNDDTTSEIPLTSLMAKTIYDNNGNGVVDDSEKLGGHLPAYFVNQQDLLKANKVYYC